MARAHIITKTILHKVYPRRKQWAHKGIGGRLLVIGGNDTLTGSAIFNSMGAYRSGCDLVYIAAPKRAADVAAAHSPNIMTYPLHGDFLSLQHLPVLLKLTQRVDAVVLGGGMGRLSDTQTLVDALVSKVAIPMVIDADAIRALGTRNRLKLNENRILTPHADEFRALTGIKVGGGLEGRVGAASAAATGIGCTVLLKGHVDVIASPDGSVALNKNGNALMTKGGFGDTLAGICGAYLARGIGPLNAAKAAAFVNGRAGDIAAKKFGESTLATDLLDSIHMAIRR